MQKRGPENYGGTKRDSFVEISAIWHFSYLLNWIHGSSVSLFFIYILWIL